MSLEWAEKIRGIRQAFSLTQEGLADLLSVAKSGIWRWEQGIDNPTPCWERVLQFIHDCPSSALDFLRQKLWLKYNVIDWAGRVREVRRVLGWNNLQLASYLGIAEKSTYTWEQGRAEGVDTCYQILITLLEVYAGVDTKQWPPGLHYQSLDLISEERIRLLRLSLAKTQAQFAGLLHVDRSTLGQWEKGRKIPGWCGNLLLRVIETFPRSIELLEKIPLTGELFSAQQVEDIRGSIGFSRLEMARLLGATYSTIITYGTVGVADPGCPMLVWTLLEKYPNELISFIQGLPDIGGQACPIW